MHWETIAARIRRRPFRRIESHLNLRFISALGSPRVRPLVGWSRLLATGSLFGAGCVFLPPGTSTGDVAALRRTPPLVLAPAPGDEWASTERPSTSTWHGASRSADLTHVAIEVEVGIESGMLVGIVTNTFTALRPNTSTIALHADGIEIREIRDAEGRPLSFRHRNADLEVTLEEPMGLGDVQSVTVRFATRAGGGFVTTLEDREQFVPEAFASGDGGALRTWLPTWDAPGDLATVDLVAEVRDDMSVVANGVLIAVEEPTGDAQRQRVYRWRQSIPIPSPEIAFAAARFETFTPGGAESDFYFHLPQRTAPETAQRTFGETPAVLEYFEAVLGAPFPFPRYDQVVLTGLDDRSRGGATVTFIDADELATVQDELDDRRERPRRTAARGIARRWFGAWIAPLQERHRWLLDGLALQLELDYEAQLRGASEVALEWEILREQIVRRARGEVLETSDLPALERNRRAERAAWTLRMIRERLGEATYWRVVRAFASGESGRVVTTEDFRRTVLDACGVDVGPEIAQWAPRKTVPEFDIRFQRRSVEGVGESLGIVVDQVQPGPIYYLDLPIVIHFEDGTSRTDTVPVNARENLLVVPITQRVVDVGIDPGGVVLAGFDIEKDDASWLAQALLSRSSVERMRALQDLTRIAEESDEGRNALIRILLESTEPTLRERYASSLTFASPAAVAALQKTASDDPSPLVRRAAVHALLQEFAAGRWEPGEDDVRLLMTLRQREVSPAALREIDELLRTIPPGA